MSVTVDVPSQKVTDTPSRRHVKETTSATLREMPSIVMRPIEMVAGIQSHLFSLYMPFSIVGSE